MVRIPRGDEVPASPEDWEEVPMGVGQDPVPSGIQWSPDRACLPLGNDIRRGPDQQTVVIVRPPERPY